LMRSELPLKSIAPDDPQWSLDFVNVNSSRDVLAG
jgi:hypothetical protein